MSRAAVTAMMAVLTAATALFAGCGANDATMRLIAQEEIQKAQTEFLKSFEPETFGFGDKLSTEWSHAQGVKTGNFIWVSGQQPVDTNVDAEGNFGEDLETGRGFEDQLRTVFGNILKVLDHYGANMDDVVFLQCFVDEKAGPNEAEFGGAAAVVREFFPNARQAMTFVSAENLYGPQQLIEANAIAVVHD